MTRKSKLSARVYALARVRIEHRTSRYACYAIEDSVYFGDATSLFSPYVAPISDSAREQARPYVLAMAEWFKPPFSPITWPWWGSSDYESRALALAFMEYFVREGIVE